MLVVKIEVHTYKSDDGDEVFIYYATPFAALNFIPTPQESFPASLSDRLCDTINLHQLFIPCP